MRKKDDHLFKRIFHFSKKTSSNQKSLNIFAILIVNEYSNSYRDVLPG